MNPLGLKFHADCKHGSKKSHAISEGYNFWDPNFGGNKKAKFQINTSIKKAGLSLSKYPDIIKKYGPLGRYNRQLLINNQQPLKILQPLKIRSSVYIHKERKYWLPIGTVLEYICVHIEFQSSRILKIY
jgi:hypothetical protein